MTHIRIQNNHAQRWFTRSLFGWLLLTIVMLSSCSPATPMVRLPTPTGLYTLDPLLGEFYSQLGGEKNLGSPISIPFQKDSLKCQYTISALLCYDPANNGTSRYRLEALGKQLGIKFSPQQNSNKTDSKIQTSYEISPRFINIYNSFQGADVVGKPLSGIYYNYSEQRVEQYFENLAFYTNFDDPPGSYGLLPYGAFHCNQKCVYQTDFTQHFLPVRQEVETPFAANLKEIGWGEQTSGHPLSKPYIAKDGNLEQVYENIVIYASPKKLTALNFRPLSALTGMVSFPPGPQRYDVAQNVTFYPINAEMGYHVPLVFDNFILQHGGRPISGDPIADTMYYVDYVPRQCFKNYCLDNHPNAAPDFQVRLVPLGIKYLQTIDPKNIIEPNISRNDINIKLHKEKQQLSSQETQKIQVNISQKPGNLPMVEMLPNLTLITPDGVEIVFSMPATGKDGNSELVIPALEKLATGSMVSYQVCLFIPGGEQICGHDTFLIWNTKQ